MNDVRNFSDERLNAFVDHQLGAQECDEILSAIAGDAELGRRVCELRSAKELVRHAYGKVPHARRVSIGSGALAASLTLAVGVVIGWLVHDAAGTRESAGLGASGAGRVVAAEPARILIHLDSARPDEMDAALDLAEAYLAKAGNARVEVIANNRGLDLLRARTTPYAARIAGIKSNYAHVSFVACGQTIARLQGGGEDVALVPEAAVTRTAIEHVAERLQQGWTYLKI